MRAHGYSGALVTVGDGNAMTMKGAPLFNRDFSRYFLRVGLCPTHILPFAGYVAAGQSSDAVGTMMIAWTRVHAIINGTRAEDFE